MAIECSELPNAACNCVKFTFSIGVETTGHAYLYILRNDQHDRPFGLLEDLWMEPKFRRLGLGRRMVEWVIRAARVYGCYKLIATSRRSRRHVHALYRSQGFKAHGTEFRFDFD